MITKIFLVALLLLLSRPLTINGIIKLEPEDIDQINDVLDNLCNYPSEVIRESVTCPELEYETKHFGNRVIALGDMAAVTFVHIVPTGRVTVEELTLPEDWEKQPEIKPTKVPVTSKVEVAVKIEFKRIRKENKFGLAMPKKRVERLNAIRLAAWKVGPKVYGITVPQDKSAKNYVPFEKYIILERIGGWTMMELFATLADETKEFSLPADYDFALELVRKILDLKILYLEGVKQVWDRGYRHCDAHSDNVIMKAFTKETCLQLEKQGVSSTKLWMIENHCMILDKKHLVLIDASFLVKVEDHDSDEVLCKDFWADGSSFAQYRMADLARVIEIWYKLKKKLMDNLPDFPLLIQMEKAMRGVEDALTAREEVTMVTRILKDLKYLRTLYTPAEERHKELRKWRNDYETSTKIFNGDKRVRLHRDIRKMREEYINRANRLHRVRRSRSAYDKNTRIVGSLQKMLTEFNKLDVERKKLRRWNGEYEKRRKELVGEETRSWYGRDNPPLVSNEEKHRLM